MVKQLVVHSKIPSSHYRLSLGLTCYCMSHTLQYQVVLLEKDQTALLRLYSYWGTADLLHCTQKQRWKYLDTKNREMLCEIKLEKMKPFSMFSKNFNCSIISSQSSENTSDIKVAEIMREEPITTSRYLIISQFFLGFGRSTGRHAPQLETPEKLRESRASQMAGEISRSDTSLTGNHLFPDRTLGVTELSDINSYSSFVVVCTELIRRLHFWCLQ